MLIRTDNHSSSGTGLQMSPTNNKRKIHGAMGNISTVIGVSPVKRTELIFAYYIEKKIKVRSYFSIQTLTIYVFHSYSQRTH